MLATDPSGIFLPSLTSRTWSLFAKVGEENRAFIRNAAHASRFPNLVGFCMTRKLKDTRTAWKEVWRQRRCGITQTSSLSHYHIEPELNVLAGKSSPVPLLLRLEFMRRGQRLTGKEAPPLFRNWSQRITRECEYAVHTRTSS